MAFLLPWVGLVGFGGGGIYCYRQGNIVYGEEKKVYDETKADVLKMGVVNIVPSDIPNGDEIILSIHLKEKEHETDETNGILTVEQSYIHETKKSQLKLRPQLKLTSDGITPALVLKEEDVSSYEGKFELHSRKLIDPKFGKSNITPMYPNHYNIDSSLYNPSLFPISHRFSGKHLINENIF